MYTSNICLFVLAILAIVVDRGAAITADDCPASVPRNNYLHLYQNWCFQFVYNRNRDYDDAAAYCKNHGGTLALIKSQDLQTYINKQVYNFVYIQNEADEPLWIGLNDKAHEGQFVWEDGTPLAYSNWGQGEGPNHSFRGSEDCVALDPYDGKWFDDTCETDFFTAIFGGEGKPYICQYEAKVTTTTNAPTPTTPSPTPAAAETTTPLPSTPTTESPEIETTEETEKTTIAECPPFACGLDCGMDGFQMNVVTGCALCECNV